MNKITPNKSLAPPARPPIISYVCQPSDFKCVSHPHTCVKASMVCDGIHDCTDHSDEFNCTRDFGSKASTTTTAVGVGMGNFKRWKKSQKRIGGGSGKQKHHQLWKQDYRRERTRKRQVVQEMSKSFGLS